MAICPKRVLKPTTAKWFSFLEKLRATSFLFRMPNTSSRKKVLFHVLLQWGLSHAK